MKIFKKMDLSLPMLAGLIISVLAITFFVFSTWIGIVAVELGTMNSIDLEKQDAQSTPTLISAYVDSRIVEAASKTWESIASGSFSNAELGGLSLFSGLWMADPSRRTLLVVTASHAESISFPASASEWLNFIPKALATGSLDPKQVLVDFSFGSDKFTRIDLHGIPAAGKELFVFTEIELGKEQPRFRGLIVREDTFFNRILGKYLEMACHNNKTVVEFLDAQGKQVLAAKGGSIKKYPSNITPEKWELEYENKINYGILKGNKIKIKTTFNWPIFFRSMEIFSSIKFAGIMVLLISLCVVYFYYQAKKSGTDLRLQNDWVTNLAHTLQSPVHSIGVLAEALISAKEGEKAKLGHLLANELSHLDRTNRRFMRLSRAGKSKLEMKPENVAVLPIIQKVIDRLLIRYPAFAREKISLENLQDLELNVDLDSFEEIFETAMDNAIKYSPNGNPIQIKGIKTGKNIVVTIRDNGLGILSDDMKMIGQPFYRGSSNDTDGITGTGLGVYLATMLCEKMNGEFILVSDGLGKGSTVKITFPGK